MKLRLEHPRILLVGPMGAGKTAIGRRLARKLGWRFLDTDIEIQERTGVDIPFIFEKEGEAGFRQRETRVIGELLGEEDCVIATGGGAILDPENRRQMSARSLVVFLSARVDTQLARTRRGRHRPLLDQADPEGVLAGLYAHREPLYREAAALTVDTDGQHVEQVARRLMKLLETTRESRHDEA